MNEGSVPLPTTTTCKHMRRQAHTPQLPLMHSNPKMIHKSLYLPSLSGPSALLAALLASFLAALLASTCGSRPQLGAMQGGNGGGGLGDLLTQ